MNSGETVELISDEGMKGITDTIKSAQLAVMSKDSNTIGTEDIYKSFRENMKDDKGDYEEAVEWFNDTLMEIGDDEDRIRKATYDEGVVLGFRYVLATFENRDQEPMFMFTSLVDMLDSLHDSLIETRKEEVS